MDGTVCKMDFLINDGAAASDKYLVLGTDSTF